MPAEDYRLIIPRQIPILERMNVLSTGFSVGAAIAFGLAAVIFIMFLLVRWARRRSTGAVAAGALLSLFAPDPTLENTIKLVEESKRLQSEEDEEGEDKDPVN
jgi:ABC-type multidrug transport system permease subunit